MLLAITTFALAAALIVILPGPDTLVVVRSIVHGGRSRALATSAGILTGLALWVSAASLGISAMLRASHVGYDILRIAGAVYLIWLGTQAFRSRRRSEPKPVTGRGGILGTGFGAGLLTDVLNPKVGVFFVTFLPGFVPHGEPVGLVTVLLGAIYILETAIYCAVLIGLAARVTSWMNIPRVRRRLDTITGMVLIAFGVRLAVES
jgi:threonine/homoserine/homoserine lactone efflux protein